MFAYYARRAWPGLVLLVVGAVVAYVGDETTALAAGGYAVAGIGGVWLVAALFWVIGASEDAERAARAGRRSPR